MTSLFRSIGIAGGILLLAGVQSASAQILDAVEFTTSFPFTVGNTTVPAGRYTITPDEDNPEILRLSGARTSVLFEMDSAQAREAAPKTEVVFKRYGDGYVLKDIWVAGSDTGAEAKALEGERHMAKSGSEREHHVAARKKAEAAKNR
jgi:hypothetical protein